MTEIFFLVGAAGYVAPRHMRAIKDTNNSLIAAFDPNDSVGVIDNYFPYAKFFTEFERFDRYAEKFIRCGGSIDYVSICSPNYLHDAHIRFALRVGANAICEKPLVLNPWNLDALSSIEKECPGNIYNILQLRLHPSLIELRNNLSNRLHDVDLTYITSRGNWYFNSWKGNTSKSGGIASNIGIHFFDLLIWLFGHIETNIVHVKESNKCAGYLKLKGANVRWFLSVDENDLPEGCNERTFRSIIVDGKEVEFSKGFADLHTASYAAILQGGGFGIDDVRPCVEATHTIRNSGVSCIGDKHPYIKKR